MKEIWKDIKNYEGFYKISNLGRVKCLERTVNCNGGVRIVPEKILKNNVNHYRNNYESVMLSKEGKAERLRIHRLVAFAFSEICGEWFEGAEVDHIDCNPQNNCATNLRWCTKEENMRNPITVKNCSLAYTEERKQQYSQRMKENNPMKKSA